MQKPQATKSISGKGLQARLESIKGGPCAKWWWQIIPVAWARERKVVVTTLIPSDTWWADQIPAGLLRLFISLIAWSKPIETAAAAWSHLVSEGTERQAVQLTIGFAGSMVWALMCVKLAFGEFKSLVQSAQYKCRHEFLGGRNC